MLALPFDDDVVPTDGELRIAKAQLVGWLEGLFHGIQATLFAQQLAARQQLEQMRQLPPGRCRPSGPGGQIAGQPRPPRHLPLTFAGGLATGVGSGESQSRQRRSNHIRLWFGQSTDQSCRLDPVADSFTHLHVHTEFSMLDGAARLDELVAKAVADGQPAIGITDHGNMYGTLEFYKECNKQGIKPIIGTEAYMAHDHRSERPTRRGRIDDSGGDTEGGKKLYYHLTLLAENETGYRNLIQLASLAFLEGYYYKPRIDWELLETLPRRADRHHRLPRRARAAVAAAGRREGRARQGRPAAGDLRQGQPVRRAAGPRPAGAARHQPEAGRDRQADRRAAARHQRLALHPPRGPRVARRAAVRADRGADQPTRSASSSRARSTTSSPPHEMRYLFRELPEACDNTLWIAERAELDDRVRQAAAARTSRSRPGSPTTPPTSITSPGRAPRQRWGDDAARTTVVERVAYELKVINDMGFASYFLIMWDLISYAQDRGIRVGPGRGSAAGCAVAYCLRITDLDPIKYDLLFERFLNPSRISMPDIDMDFDSRYRDEMIRYAAERYGRDHVAQIITFGTIKARNAVRDAARCSATRTASATRSPRRCRRW